MKAVVQQAPDGNPGNGDQARGTARARTAAALGAAKRHYGGKSPEERKRERRQRILQAAMVVYGEQGYRNSTVETVCRVAGLTKRYFYESYSDSNELLEDCFRTAVAEFVEELSHEVPAPPIAPRDRARAILAIFFERLRDDPAQARLFLLEADGVSPGVSDAMRDAQAAVADLLAPPDAMVHDGARGSLQRLGAVAGVARISSLWIAGGCSVALEDVVESALSLFEGLLAAD